MPDGKLWAISDLHVAYEENRKIVEGLHPESPDDWLIVAGDVGELMADISWALELLAGRYARVIWTPGNHELWTPKDDPVQLRGEARYRHVVELCRSMGVLTPEDPYPRWTGPGGPLVVAPLFLLYDYSWRTPGARTKEQALEEAYDTGVVCSDEFLLHPDPYPSRDAWCRARVAATERRLAACDPEVPLVLANHYPLVREPTDILRFPQFAQWCGTDLTADWHLRFSTHTMVYGHLHIPRSTRHDGVPFEEVSVGYPREWQRPGHPRNVPRQIAPRP
ncbi:MULTISPECIES: metallophosphoesterase family protein [unclassified Streptomyces]|uniref:metallophosphoesterase family protein n=1 Tax=unclassified Streptomyces TaxID=2593676 RepID=UPI0022B671A2|nr:MULTISPECIES: metallophosphoesterase [unclassified Streptomyces]MCZ7414365.1 metallophosphoesterase [Streptomyces sp. WMMC897]MCZ7431320.1 metallophosphoesterase [Streptomyces sp. WMMC1477]